MEVLPSHFKLKKHSDYNAILKSRCKVTSNSETFYSNIVTVYINEYRPPSYYKCTSPFWRY